MLYGSVVVINIVKPIRYDCSKENTVLRYSIHLVLFYLIKLLTHKRNDVR